MNYGRQSGYGQDGIFSQSVGTQQGRRDASTSKINIQDAFLNHCRREKMIVEITTINNQTCTGTIAGFDNVVIAMEKDGRQQLVFKSAIIVINPIENVNYIFNETYRPDAYRHDGLRANAEYANDFA